MSPLICELAEDLLPLYHEGRLNPVTRQEVAEHLEKCPACREKLRNLEKLGGDILGQLNHAPRDAKRELNVVRRARRRLWAVIGILFWLYLLLVLFFPAVYLLRDNREAERALALVTELTNPGMRIHRYGTYSTFFPPGPRIWVEAAGPLSAATLRQEARITWLGRLSLAGLERWGSLEFPLFPGDSYSSSLIDSQKEALQNLPKYYKAEAVISFHDYLTPVEVDRFMLGRELDPVWAAFDARQDDGRHYHVGFSLAPGQSFVQNSRRFEEEIEWLGQRYPLVKGVLAYPRVDLIAEFVQKEGVRVYGLIVTGAAGELKHLFEDESVRSVRLGEIAFRRD